MITLRKLDRTNSNLTKPYNLGITRIIKFRTRNKLDSPLYFAHRLVLAVCKFSAKLGSGTPSSGIEDQNRHTNFTAFKGNVVDSTRSVFGVEVISLTTSFADSYAFSAYVKIVKFIVVRVVLVFVGTIVFWAAFAWSLGQLFVVYSSFHTCIFHFIHVFFISYMYFSFHTCVWVRNYFLAVFFGLLKRCLTLFNASSLGFILLYKFVTFFILLVALYMFSAAEIYDVDALGSASCVLLVSGTKSYSKKLKNNVRLKIEKRCTVTFAREGAEENKETNLSKFLNRVRKTFLNLVQKIRPEFIICPPIFGVLTEASKSEAAATAAKITTAKTWSNAGICSHQLSGLPHYRSFPGYARLSFSSYTPRGTSFGKITPFKHSDKAPNDSSLPDRSKSWFAAHRAERSSESSQEPFEFTTRQFSSKSDPRNYQRIEHRTRRANEDKEAIIEAIRCLQCEDITPENRIKLYKIIHSKSGEYTFGVKDRDKLCTKAGARGHYDKTSYNFETIGALAGEHLKYLEAKGVKVDKPRAITMEDVVKPTREEPLLSAAGHIVDSGARSSGKSSSGSGSRTGRKTPRDEYGWTDEMHDNLEVAVAAGTILTVGAVTTGVVIDRAADGNERRRQMEESTPVEERKHPIVKLLEDECAGSLD